LNNSLFIGILLLILPIEKIIGQGCSDVSVKVSPSSSSPPKRDTTVCKGSALALSVSVPTLRATTSYTVNTIPYIDPIPCESTGSLVAGSGINIDDGYSSIQNIGFDFCFFGVSRNQLQICDNGFLTFSVNKPVLSTLTAPFLVQSLPLAANPNPAAAATTLPPNSIMGAWMDAYLVTGGSNPGGGTITTQLVGTAPFRAYIVKWNDCKYYNSSCRPIAGMLLSMKIVLYETTNLIDIYIKTKPICTVGTTFRYLTTQGIQGDSAFKFAVTPGRNNSLWDGVNSAVRYTPNGTINTTTIQWTKNGLPISATSIANITHSDDSANYVASINISQPCPSGSLIARDTIKVIGQNNTVNVINIFDTISCLPSKLFDATNASALSYMWDNGSVAPTRLINTSGRYFVVRRYNALGCNRDTVFYNIRKYDAIKIDSVKRIGCFNSANLGQLRLSISGDTSGWLVGINSNPVSKVNPIANQRNGTFSYWVRNGGNCRDSITLTHDSLRANYFKRTNFCNGDSSGLMRLSPIGGYTPFSYGLTGRTNQAIDSFQKITTGIYIITLTDINGCSISRTDTIIPFTNLSLNIAADSARCFGANTGRIIASLSGGVPSYTYSINNGAFVASGSFINLSAGIYIIKTKDSKNCSIDTSITILQNTQIQLNLSKQRNCPFNANGVISGLASGGKPSYMYSLNGGSFQSSNTFSGILGGPLAVSVRDNLNCIRTFQDTLLSHPKPKLNLIEKKNLSCYASNDGKIKVNTSTGLPPYIYSWSATGNADSLISLGIGTYTAFVLDNNGCRDTLITAITQPDSLTASFILKNPLCHNQASGSIKVIGIGGTPGYRFSINSGAFNSIDSFTNLAAVSYTIHIRDSNLCLKTYSRTLTNPSALNMLIGIDSVLCFGGNSGNINLLATGGTSGFTYRINSGAYASPNVFSGLVAGMYTASVRDTNGCVKDSNVMVRSYSKINSSITVLDTIRCKNGSNGRISITASGGKSPYTYSINGGSFQTSNVFSGLDKGMKYIRVKDVYNCEIIDSIFMINPVGIISTINVIRNVSCYGLSNAKTKVIVTGGAAPYTYLWSNGITLDSNSTLNKGFHYVKILDNINCRDSVNVSISEPDSLHATLSIYNPRCHNTLGSIKINPIGGTSPYQYSFNSGAYSALDSFPNLTGQSYSITIRDTNACSKTMTAVLIAPSQLLASFKMDSARCFGDNTGKITVNKSGGTGAKIIRSNSLVQSSDTIKNLTAGFYYIEVLDANNCKVDTNISLLQYPDINISIIKDTVLCYGASAAAITINGSGGAGGFQYGVNSSAFGSSNVVTNLPATTHTAKVRDMNLCIKSLPVVISQLDSMIINPQLTQNLCYRDSLGKAKFNVTGGSSPYTYSFNNAAFSSFDSFINLPAGTYPYSVRDKNNCLKTGSVVITQPQSLISSIIIDSVRCFKQTTGSIQVNPSGGTPGYSISFNGQGYASTSLFASLAAGNYNIKIRDANQCIKDTNVIVRSSDSFYYLFTVDSLDCFNANNGRVTLTPLGGKSPYQYSLNAGAFNSNNVISNLTPTAHSIKIKDVYNCTLSLNIALQNPSPILIQIDSNISNPCFGDAKGRLQISSSGAKLPHTYLWSNGLTAARITALLAGSYSVTVRDAKNCIKTQSIAISQPSDFSIVPIQQNLKCFGDADGSISIAVTGASPGYTYLWSNGNATTSIINLIRGIYSVTVTDANSCIATRNYNLTQPDSISFNLAKTNSNCAASKDGTISVANYSGGTGNPSFAWSHGPTAMNLGSLEPFKTYTVTITDVNNCQRQKSIYIDTIYVLRIKVDTLGIPRCPYSQLNLKLTPLSGSIPFEFNLGGLKNSTGDFLNQKNQKYVYSVQDKYNCIFTDSIDLVPRDTMNLNVILYPPPCESANIFPVKANVSGSKKPYTFNWPRSFLAIGDSARYNESGYYEVEVRDNYNCLVKTGFNLTLPEGALQGVFTERKNLRCFKLNDGMLKIEGRGGVPPYKYLWSTGETSERIFNLEANKIYQVTIFDSDTCRYVMDGKLSQPDSLEIGINKTDKTCLESSNATISLIATGGNPSYRYSIDTSQGYQKDSIFYAVKEGNYLAVVRDDSSCTAAQPVSIGIKYVLNLTLDSIYQIKSGATIFINPSLSLMPSSAFYIPTWTPSLGLSCTDCLSTEFSGYHTTHLNLNLKYGEGCIADYTTLVKVEDTEKDELFVPNVFSPKAENEENRTFKAYSNRVLRFEMSVYNRWGEKVFDTDDIRIGWDGNYKGEPSPAGVYTYTLKLTKLDGIRLIKSGEVSLF
jgi:gliding motility-associated-like protein